MKHTLHIEDSESIIIKRKLIFEKIQNKVFQIDLLDIYNDFEKLTMIAVYIFQEIVKLNCEKIL